MNARRTLDFHSYEMVFPGSTKKSRLWGKNKVVTLVFTVFLFGVLLILVNIYQLRMMQNDHVTYHGGAMVEGSVERFDGQGKPVVWVDAKRPDSGYLQHVFAVFERAGYTRMYTSAVEGTAWHVLWAHDYPFSKLKDKLLNLKPHQRVNHFPGSGFITNKAYLVGSKLRFTPKAFKIPDEKEALLAYAKEKPDLMWVQKSGNHRGIQIKPVYTLDLKTQGTFVQQFIHDPYLIDGHRFDIGIYTVLTSIDPLRIYVYDADWLIRFCAEKYYPFNPTNINKYVVTDNYKPIWRIPSLHHYYNIMDYPMRETILGKLRQEGRDADKLVNDLQQAIVEVYLAKEHALIEAALKYKSSGNFFEMVRFDFVLDNQLNVYLMEVNMSPNLSSGHFYQNRLLYEHVVYGLLSVVGVVKDTSNTFDTSQSEDEKNMLVSSRDIRVNSQVCGSDICFDNCGKQICKLCGECMKPHQIEAFKLAYMEHNNRKTYRRVFPLPFKSQDTAMQWQPESDLEFRNLTNSNQWMTRWFHGKCLQDATWCS